jgi:hypothetical protein
MIQTGVFQNVVSAFRSNASLGRKEQTHLVLHSVGMHPNHHQKNQLVLNTHASSVTDKAAFLRKECRKGIENTFLPSDYSCGMKKRHFGIHPFKHQTLRIENE